MRQSNGAALFSSNDPRGATIGIINVDPEDDRQSILTAILTQEKVGRRQTILVLPAESDAFQPDFKEVMQRVRDLQTQLIFVAPADSNFAKFARQHRYLVFSSLENYARYAQTFLNDQPAPPSSPIPSSSPSSGTQATSPQPVADDVQGINSLSTPEPDIRSASPLPDEEDGNSSIPPQKPANTSSDQIAPPTLPPSHRPFQPLATIFSRGVQRATPSASNRTRRQRGRSLRVILRFWPLAVLLLLLGGSVLGVLSGYIPLAHLFPGITSATITITPDSKHLQSTYTITAVLSQPDETQPQIQARFLSATTPPQTQTVAALGHGTLPATQAQGFLTFYNALPYEQKVPAGTVFTDDKGIQVANSENVVIPAAQPPTEGFVTTPAHALLAGADGNIPALHFNFLPCCHDGVTVENIDAFQGGQNQQAYTYIQQSDIDNAARSLLPALLRRGESALRAQILAQERQAAPLSCLPLITSNQPAGVQADRVTVTVKVTCTGEVYNQQAAQLLAENLFKKDGGTMSGPNYTLSGPVKTTITGVTQVDTRGIVLLHVLTAGRWVYQFYTAQKDEIIRSVAGENAQRAQSILAQQRGVGKARIDLFLAAENMLPENPRQITLVLQSPP